MRIVEPTGFIKKDDVLYVVAASGVPGDAAAAEAVSAAGVQPSDFLTAMPTIDAGAFKSIKVLAPDVPPPPKRDARDDDDDHQGTARKQKAVDDARDGASKFYKTDPGFPKPKPATGGSALGLGSPDYANALATKPEIKE